MLMYTWSKHCAVKVHADHAVSKQSNDRERERFLIYDTTDVK